MTQYEVVGIGNAVVDVITHADDSFLDHMGIQKGIMQLIERERAEVLYASMESRIQTPGGSVANTVAGVGALGLKTGFIGRVNDDALGQFYADAMNQGGTDFVNAPIKDGALPTSRCMVFVSPDGERSLNTYLGISSDLGPEDVSEDVAGQAEIIFLEGYLFDKDKGKEAFLQAARNCRAANGKTGIAISDPFCVDRHRDEFAGLIKDGKIDILFSNEDEIKSLYQVDSFDEAKAKVSKNVEIAALTRGEKGAVIINGDDEFVIAAEAVDQVIDTTGAGDQFAAGFLYGFTEDMDMATCGKLGAIAAAEVISHIGPRPLVSLAELQAKAA